jgi:hypothetical protein
MAVIGVYSVHQWHRKSCFALRYAMYIRRCRVNALRLASPLLARHTADTGCVVDSCTSALVVHTVHHHGATDACGMMPQMHVA